MRKDQSLSVLSQAGQREGRIEATGYCSHSHSSFGKLFLITLGGESLGWCQKPGVFEFISAENNHEGGE